MAEFVISGSLKICKQVLQCLLTAKHNKQETGTLKTAVLCIENFLKRVPESCLSAEGVMVLGTLQTTLQDARDLLEKVCNTGPLEALLKATFVRDDFNRINRDLINTFQLLASIEKLLDLTQGRMDAKEAKAARMELQQQAAAVEDELRRNQSTFFVKQEQIGGRLMDIAAAAGQNETPEPVVQQQLLDQLSKVAAVVELSPDELLAELQALQLDALYDTHVDTAADGQATGTAGDQGADTGQKQGKKLLGNDTEDFLVQQLCAALAPRAAKAGRPLTPELAAKPPDAYLCPISGSVMATPVILVETGQTYEVSAIKRWLFANRKCPVTGRRLTSKQLAPNYALKSAIEHWAKEHKLRLPAAHHPHQPFAVTEPSEGSSADDNPIQGDGGIATTVKVSGDSSSGSRGTDPVEVLIGGPKQAPADDRKGLISKPLLKCTRTKWAVFLIVAALLVGGSIAGGVVAWKFTRPNPASTAATPPSGSNSTRSQSRPFRDIPGRIVSKLSSKCLDGYDNVTARIYMMQCQSENWSNFPNSMNPYQVWGRPGPGDLRLQNNRTTKCLASSSAGELSPVVSKPCDADDDLQKWVYDKQLRLRSKKNDRLCLDIVRNSQDNFAELILFWCVDSKANQQWVAGLDA